MCRNDDFFWRPRRQQQAAKLLLVLVGVGTVAGMYWGLKNVQRQDKG